MQNVLNINELQQVIKSLKSNNKKIVTTNGCFDILHAGHVRYLNKAKALGDVLIVCMNTDESVRRLKGPSRPVNKQDDRAEVLSSLRSVDYVVFFDEDTPVDMLDFIKPDIHTKGGDYTEETLPEASIIKKNGGKVCFIDLVEGRSTTNIITKVQQG